jgi:hypothetical protein
MGRRRAGKNSGFITSAALLLLSGQVFAQASAGDPSAVVPPVPEISKTEPKAPTTDPKSASKSNSEEEAPETPQIRLKGRVFARGEVDERQEFARKLSLPSARLGVEGTLSYMQAVVEADVADKNILKDAYLRVRTANNHARFYAGQFKAPFLERELESTWDLPRIRRGVVADVLIDNGGLGGRRLGVMGELKMKPWMGLQAELGVFQGEPDVNTMVRGEDLSARVSFKPFKLLRLGVTSYAAQVLNGTPRFGYGVEGRFELGGFALNAEAINGKLGLGPYSAIVTAATYTFALDRRGKFELQPALCADALQLRGPLAGRGYSGTAGLNLIYDQRLKLMLQMERALRPGDAKPGSSFGMQLAARF